MQIGSFPIFPEEEEEDDVVVNGKQFISVQFVLNVFSQH